LNGRRKNILNASTMKEIVDIIGGGIVSVIKPI
jgi:hypothetical protein